MLEWKSIWDLPGAFGIIFPGRQTSLLPQGGETGTGWIGERLVGEAQQLLLEKGRNIMRHSNGAHSPIRHESDIIREWLVCLSWS